MQRSPGPSYVDFVEIIGHALNGLSAVHTEGIVHRDLKPENIFLVAEADGSFPKILDFGISKTTDSGLLAPHTTREGLLAGTPHYMSPEQARGLKQIDHRIDIYAMGAILYEALVGRPPFDSENPGDLLIEIVKGDARPVEWLRPELGSALSDVVAKAMSREPEDRYANALEMRDALMDAAARTSMPAAAGDVATVSMRPATSRDRGAGSIPARTTPTAPLIVLDEEETVRPPSRRVGPAMQFGLSLLVAGAVGAVIAELASEMGESESPPSTPMAAPVPSSMLPAAPGATTIHISLRGVSERAEVLIDGARTVGPEIDLPRDAERLYTIEVRPERGAPWRVYHRGGDGAVYDIDLASRPARSVRNERPSQEESTAVEGEQITPPLEGVEVEQPTPPRTGARTDTETDTENADPAVSGQLEEPPTAPAPQRPAVWREFEENP